MFGRWSLLAAGTLALAGCAGSSTDPREIGGARIVFEVDTVAVNQGRAVQVSARLLDAAGVEVPDAPIAFTVSDARVASVSQSGVLNGLAPGATDVRASSGDVNASVPVDVFGHPEGLHIGRVELTDRPFGIDVSRDGVVYVTRLDAARVSRLDVETRAFTGDITVGSVPTGVTFHPGGSVAYVTNQHDGVVGVIDVATSRQIATIPLDGTHPYVTFVTPDGAKLYIAGNSTTIFVANTETRAITATVEVGASPNGVALAPGDTVMYVSASWGGSVSEIDVRTDAVLRTFMPGGMPQGVVVSRDGDELYVANEHGWLDVYSLASGERLERVELAGGGFGMALSPDQAHLYVGLAQSGTVQVVNIPSRRVIHTFEVGGVPRRIAFTRHGGAAVVANEGGWVDFIR